MIQYDVLIVGGGIVGIYLARNCSLRGLSVCIIEKGGDSQSEPTTSPSVVFLNRENLAVVEARNHILGGNSRFWGGALVEDDGALIESMGFKSDSSPSFAELSERVYSRIGIRGVRRNSGFFQNSASLCEFPVLTGKFRNIWSGGADSIRSSGIDCILFGEISCVKNDHLGNFAEVETASGVITIRFSSIVISAGVVDSIRLVGKLFPSILESDNLLGKGLNDHLSFEVLSFPWKKRPISNCLFPPRFDRNITLGYRAEFVLQESGRRGFVHIQAPYDDVEPYRSLKKLVFAKQRQLNIWQFLGALGCVMSGGLSTLRLAFDRFVNKRLYYPTGGVVRLLVDLESSSNPNNFVAPSGDCGLNWGLSKEDLDSIREASIFAFGLIAEDMFEGDVRSLMRESVDASLSSQNIVDKCTEALHLGGGLQNSVLPLSGSGLRCKLDVDVPAFVISTAIFPRAGVANPVHTLLVCAEIISDFLHREKYAKVPL